MHDACTRGWHQKLWWKLSQDMTGPQHNCMAHVFIMRAMQVHGFLWQQAQQQAQPIWQQAKQGAMPILQQAKPIIQQAKQMLQSVSIQQDSQLAAIRKEVSKVLGDLKCAQVG